MAITIHMELKDKTLTVKPEGRLDTNTSPQLEARLASELPKVNDIVIDFEAVEYISSGGLRVLLNTEQEMENRKGTLKIIHVNEYIMEVFEMTGFLDILAVE